MKIFNLLNSKKITWALFLFNCLTFLILLFKNPYSERNLIPNLEPYPDAIHYLTPALSFIRGNGFYIEREGRLFKPTVPFLYSLTLVPGFLINNDVRSFYFTNIILAFSGMVLFYIFLNRITSNKLIPELVIFFYITNYFVYWYPNLAMAENLGLTLFMAALFLLTEKVSPRYAVLASFISVAFYAAKYASFTLSAVLAFSYFIKILIDGETKINLTKNFISKKSKLALTFVLSSILALGLFFISEYLIRGSSVFEKIGYLIQPLISPPEKAVDLAVANPWFSYSYFNRNFPIYFNALMGTPMRFLWDFTPLLPRYLSWLSLLGILTGLFNLKYRFVSLYLFLFILAPILFLSTFYAADARYIYHVIPGLLAGLSIFLSRFFDFLNKKNLQVFFYIFLIVLFGSYSLTNFSRLKLQAVLNLKYAETPWNYLAAKNFNQFFTQKQNAVLITAIPPYYLDYFSGNKYKLLPLSTEQEFINSREIVWGPDDYSSLINLYKKYLNQNREVFVTNASLGNTPFLHRDFDLIKENFDLLKVNEGCLDTCNIYQLKIKQ